MQNLRHAVVRGAVLADFDAAIETQATAPNSLNASLHMLSVADVDPSSVFVGDGGPGAVVEYTVDHATGVNEVNLRKEFPDWLEWPLLPQGTQDRIAAQVASNDTEFGDTLIKEVLKSGWVAIATGGATPISFLAYQMEVFETQLMSALTGGLSLLHHMLETVPDSVMSPLQRATFRGAIEAWWHKWPRPVDQAPVLPPQVQDKTASYALTVAVPGYRVGNSTGGDLVVSLPPLALSGVIPYYPTRVKVTAADGINRVIIRPDGAELIDGVAELVITAPTVVVLGGTASEWTDLNAP